MLRGRALQVVASSMSGALRGRASAVSGIDVAARLGAVRAFSAAAAGSSRSVSEMLGQSSLVKPVSAVAVRSAQPPAGFVSASQSALMSTLVGEGSTVTAATASDSTLGVADEDDETRARRTFLKPTDQQEGNAKVRSGQRVVRNVALASQLKQKLDADLEAASRLNLTGATYNSLQAAFEALKSDSLEDQAKVADLDKLFELTSLRTASADEVHKAKIKAVIQHYQRRPGDTGSTEVQVAVLTERIATIEAHMKEHHKDVKLKRDFSIILQRRRKLLDYLRVQRFRTYQVLVRDLGIDEKAMENFGRLTTTLPFLRVERDPLRHVKLNRK